jgi:hypothetical protein
MRKCGELEIWMTDDEEIRASRIFKPLMVHFIQKVQLTDKEIRAVVKRVIEKGHVYWISILLKVPFTQKFQLTDEEIRASVRKIIEKGDGYDILALLKVDSNQEVQWTDEEIRAVVRQIIEKIDKKLSFGPSMTDFTQGFRLTNEEIRASVRKIIEKGDGYYILGLLKAHFDQKIQLTDEEIRAAFKKIIKIGDKSWIFPLLEDHFPKLTQIQIVAFAKETAPNEMPPFLRDYSEKLDVNRFQWIVEASSPLCICSFWKKYPPTLSQEKFIILKKKVIDVERQKLIAILKAVSKHRGCFTLIWYLKNAPWQNLTYLLPESDG